MTEKVPHDRKGFIPHLVCSNAAEAIEFYKKAFGAQEIGRLLAPDGERMMHAEVSIDGYVVFLADDFPEYCGGKSQNPLALGGSCVSLHRYVEDCDAAMQQAIDAGATVKMPAMDMFWGDRYGSVEDPFGHVWSLATHQKDLTHDEIQAGMKAAFEQAPPQ